ncbi:MAG: hypothetical protein KDA80_16805, partial [Planctomycetaceae bacterium]|nr:hypothetical protein [Planctomycetaceae bacterium]
AIVSIDAFMYFGTDELFLNSLARFVKPGGQVGIAQSGFVQEIHHPVPAHLAEWWTMENPYCLHSADWWRRHWEQTRIVDVAVSDTLVDGWGYWHDWLTIMGSINPIEMRALEEDAGRYLGYIRVVARRREEAELFDPDLSLPSDYVKQPLLRSP